jgi:hypothetical protein
MMGKFKKFRPFILLFIPLILFLFFCSAILIFRGIGFFNNLNSSPDYLWSQRITQRLMDEGYSVNDVIINTNTTPVTLRVIEIRVEIDIQQHRAYNVIEDVHRIMIEEFSYPSSQPNPVDKVIVMLDDDDNYPFGVISDFEFAWKYHNGQISQDVYFENWSYGGEIPGITPP